MNSQTITRAKSFTKSFTAVAVLLVATSAVAGWKVDLSRRQKTLREAEAKTETAAATTQAQEQVSLLDNVFSSEDPVQEVVILNTEKGFLPSTVRMKKGGKYVVHVVNVNEKEKNVSFVLDAFSEHHATYYGKVQTFKVEPKREGIYSFQSPETSIEGRLIVINPQSASTPTRLPSAE